MPTSKPRARLLLAYVRARLRNTSGQALVETALVFSLLTTVLAGVAELGYVMHVSIAVSNAAKAAAQYGAQNGFTAMDSTGMITAASNEAPNLTLVTTPNYSCICSDGSASTCSNNDCTTSHIEQIVTVSTSTTVTPLIHLPGLPKTFTITGSAIQKCLR